MKVENEKDVTTQIKKLDKVIKFIYTIVFFSIFFTILCFFLSSFLQTNETHNQYKIWIHQIQPIKEDEDVLLDIYNHGATDPKVLENIISDYQKVVMDYKGLCFNDPKIIKINSKWVEIKKYKLKSMESYLNYLHTKNYQDLKLHFKYVQKADKAYKEYKFLSDRV
jgi:hypothetical protein